jgi:hypothetical protein
MPYPAATATALRRLRLTNRTITNAATSKRIVFHQDSIKLMGYTPAPFNHGEKKGANSKLVPHSGDREAPPTKHKTMKPRPYRARLRVSRVAVENSRFSSEALLRVNAEIISNSLYRSFDLLAAPNEWRTGQGYNKLLRINSFEKWFCQQHDT